MSEQHYKDLCEIQDMLADIQQVADFAERTAQKLRVLHADIRKRIGKVDLLVERK